MIIFNSKPNLLAAVLLFLITACSTTKKIEKNISEQNEKETFFKGLVVFDPALNKELINYNGEKYFTRLPIPNCLPFMQPIKRSKTLLQDCIITGMQIHW